MGRSLSTATSVGGYGLIDIWEKTGTTNAYTYTTPAGAKSLLIYMTAGGGGGGSGSNDFNAGGGGGGGGTGIKLIVDPVASYHFNPGSGGAGAGHNPNSPGSGSTGGDSRLYEGTNTSGTLVMDVPGGSGGYKADGGQNPGLGGQCPEYNSGDWGGCDLQISGGGGGPSGGGYNTDNAQSGGHGGGTWWMGLGGNCGARYGGEGRPGLTAVGPGTGGGGGQCWNPGNGGSGGGSGQHGGILIYCYGSG